MVTVNSILSLDQGKLNRHPKNDDDYWSTFREVQKPEVGEIRRGYGLRFEWTLWPARRSE